MFSLNSLFTNTFDAVYYLRTMGNTDSVVVQKRLARFRPDERPCVEGTFDRLHDANSSVSAGKAGKCVTLDMLKVSMGKMASDSMIERIFQGVSSINPGVPVPDGGISREQLVIFLADVLRGTAEERAPLVMAMSAGAKATTTTTEKIKAFLGELVSSAVQTLAHRGQLRAWRPDRMGDGPQGVALLAEQLTSEIESSDQNACDIPCLEDWLFRVPAMAVFLELLIGEGLGVDSPSRPPPTLLPPCGSTCWSDLHCLLSLPVLMFLSPQLPAGHAAPWRLLFSTHSHGESFTRLLGNCRGRGPTVLLVKDTKGHVFGGFSSQSWEVKPQFQGDSRCFLFSVFPVLRVFTSTGYNDHYTYLNQGQQTMPNGLGMGGQHGYFGLWLDCDFGRGHSKARPRCTTYASPQLSADEDFKIDALEVWGVGVPPEEQDENKKSILDVDPEAQALLEMTGKSMHSQGLREPEEDEG